MRPMWIYWCLNGLTVVAVCIASQNQAFSCPRDYKLTNEPDLTCGVLCFCCRSATGVVFMNCSRSVLAPTTATPATIRRITATPPVLTSPEHWSSQANDHNTVSDLYIRKMSTQPNGYSIQEPSTTPLPASASIEQESPGYKLVKWALRDVFYKTQKVCDDLQSNPNRTIYECKDCYLEFFPISCLMKVRGLKQLLLPQNRYLSFNMNILLKILPKLETLDLSDQHYLDIKWRRIIKFPKHDFLRVLRLSNNLLVKDVNTGIDLTGLHNLTEVDLGNTCIEFILEKLNLCGLINLESLIFRNNRAIVLITPPFTIFKTLQRLKRLDLGGNRLGESNDHALFDLFLPVSNTLENLNLEGNKLTNLSARVLSRLTSLRTVNLQSNFLRTLPALVFAGSTNLHTIQLESNRINYLDVETFKPLENLQDLRIGDNEFQCDCALRAFRDWAVTDGLFILGILSHGEFCHKQDGNENKRITKYTMNWIECDNHLDYIIAAIIMVCVMTIVLTGTLTYRYRYDILFWWVIRRRRRHDVTSGERYHAFVSYNSSDAAFTIAMIKALENGDDLRFKLSFDGRDFLGGEFISDCIVQCIERSEKIIFVISRSFLLSEWCTYELRMGELKCFEEKRNIMILVFLEEIPQKELPRSLRTLVRQINYIQWPVNEADDSRAREVFWKRLKLSLSKDIKFTEASTESNVNQTDELTVV